MQKKSSSSLQANLLSEDEQKRLSDDSSERSHSASILIPVRSNDVQKIIKDFEKSAENSQIHLSVTATSIPGTKDYYVFGVNLNFTSEVQQNITTGTLVKLLKVIFIPTASLAAIFYWNYAKACVRNTECVKLVSFTSDDLTRKIILTVSGGSGFAFANMYFANLAAESIVDFVKKTGLARATLSLLPYIALQVSMVTFAALGAEDSEFLSPQVLLPALAVIPSAIYSKLAAGNSTSARYFFSEVQQLTSLIYQKMVPAFTAQEKIARKEREHYRNEFHLFQRRVDYAQHQILSNIEQNVLAKCNQSPEQILLEHFKLDLRNTHERSQWLNTIISIPGISLATIVSATFVANIYEQVPRIGRWAEGPIQLLTTLIIGTISNIPSYQLLVPTVNALMGIILCQLPQSVALSLYLKTTLAITAISFLSQSVSHSAVYNLFNDTYDGPGKSVLIWIACAGIVLYHTKGALNLGLALLRGRVTDKASELAFYLESHYNQLVWTPFSEFLKEVETMPDAKRKQFGITTFDEVRKIESRSAPSTIVRQEKEAVSKPEENSKRKSWCTRLFCFFKQYPNDKHDDEPDFNQTSNAKQNGDYRPIPSNA